MLRGRSRGLAVCLLGASSSAATAFADGETPPPAREGPSGAPVAPAPQEPASPRGTTCLGFEVPEGRFSVLDMEWRAGAWTALDAIVRDTADDQFGFTEFRPTLDGRGGPFTFRLEADVIGVDTPRNLYEAWAAMQVVPWLRVTAGQFRVALGSEFATHEKDLPWIDYAFMSRLDGRWDVGVRADGNVTDGLWYQAAAVAGHGFDTEGHRRTSPQVSLRGVLHPARVLGARDQGILGALRGLHVGLAYAALTDGDESVDLQNPLDQRVFDTEDLDGDSGDWLHVELGFVSGPFQLGFERTIGALDDVPVPGGTNDMDELTGFAWGVALNLTGEPRGWKDGAFVPATAPRERGRGLLPFLPDGRWEAAARYSNGDIDRDLFDFGLTTYDVSSQETRTVSLAVFWEPCERVRLGLEWVKTHLDHEIASFDYENRDSSFVLRLELRF